MQGRLACNADAHHHFDQVFICVTAYCVAWCKSVVKNSLPAPFFAEQVAPLSGYSAKVGARGLVLAYIPLFVKINKQ